MRNINKEVLNEAPFVGIIRIRFTGYNLSPTEGHPCFFPANLRLLIHFCKFLKENFQECVLNLHL